MPAAREDYLLTQIELLRQFVARLRHAQEPVGLEDALRLALDLQEKLFPLPVAEFLRLDATAQILALQAGETPVSGREKCRGYAELLQMTAALYEFRGRPELAAGARQLALHVVLHLALATPDHSSPINGLVQTWRPLLAPDDLSPPVRDMLLAFDAQTSRLNALPPPARPTTR